MNKGRILVIDDEEIIRESCRRVLEPAGHQVDTAASGGEGLQVLTTEAIDLVLTDLKMPDMDGIEVLRTIKQDWPDVEVIIITGYQTVDTAVKSIKLGAFDYIEKPFTPDALISAVSKALDHKKT
jgi:DNA-binding NtrC family response regulator